MKTLNNWAQRALLLLGVCFVMGLSSCEQEVIEPDFITVAAVEEIETEDDPQPTCTGCEDK